MKCELQRIGILVKDESSDLEKGFVDGLADACREKDIALFVFSVGDTENSLMPFSYHNQALFHFVNTNNLDGLIVTSPLIKSWYEKGLLDSFIALFGELPLVSLGEKIPGVHSIIPDKSEDIKKIFDEFCRKDKSNLSIMAISLYFDGLGTAAVDCLLNLINKKPQEDLIIVTTPSVSRNAVACRRFESSEFAAASSKWLEIQPQFRRINSFNATAQIRQNITMLRKSFREDVQPFGITGAALVLYDTPVFVSEIRQNFAMPEKASVLASFDDTMNLVQNTDEPPIEFSPSRELIPSGLVHFSPGIYYVEILYNCESQYGYIVFRKGAYLPMVYSMLVTVLSRLLWTSYENSKNEREQRLQAERAERLNRISKTDDMTELLNRRGFMELGQQTIDISLALRQGGMVIFGDMDGLKNINDNYGHDAGDRAIKAEAEILKKNFRVSDIIGRLGGDEFVIIAPDLTEANLGRIRENIDAACRAWNIVHNEDFILSISLGCQPYSSEDCVLENILKQADRLLYEEKREKKNSRCNS